MCRSTNYHGYSYSPRDCLKIKAFFIRFSGRKLIQNSLPESLTLLYPPRINEAVLELDGSKIRPDSPAFVTLHRVIAEKTKLREAVYGSRERVRVGEGVRFEVHNGEEKVVKGIFRRDEGENWKLECRCEMEGEADLDMVVAVEGRTAMSERVGMVSRREGGARGRKERGLCCLEEIPEVECEADGGECLCTCPGSEEEEEGCEAEEEGVEGMRWAVDVGIWVMCLGVGYLVSRASAKRFRRGRGTLLS